MIFDTLSNLESYCKIHTDFYKALDFIKANDLMVIENGKYDLGGGSYVIVSEYETADKPNKAESHKNFIDIQIIVIGLERMVWQPLKTAILLEEYNAEKDVMFWESNEYATDLIVSSGMFAIFFPEDVHQPNLCTHRTPTINKKVLFKIPVI